jgi:hypothetical protein
MGLRLMMTRMAQAMRMKTTKMMGKMEKTRRGIQPMLQKISTL